MIEMTNAEYQEMFAAYQNRQNRMMAIIEDAVSSYYEDMNNMPGNPVKVSELDIMEATSFVLGEIEEALTEASHTILRPAAERLNPELKGHLT